MILIGHRVAARWLEKQPQVRVASLWLAKIYKIASKKKNFLDRAQKVADYWHHPQYAEKARQLVDTDFPADEKNPEEGTFRFPPTTPEYFNFALDHLGNHEVKDIANMVRDLDTYSKRQSPEVKKQLLHDLKSVPFSRLRNRIPPASSDKERKKDSEKIYEDDRWRVTVPLSHKSMRGHGVNTGWCISTAHPGYASMYRRKDNLHLFVADKTKPEKDQRGKYAITFNDKGGSRADVRDTYDKEGPGHDSRPESAMREVAKTLGMPDEVRDQAWSGFKEKQRGLTERMKKYPRREMSMGVELSAALIYEDSVSADQLRELEDLQGKEFYKKLDPDARFLAAMKDQKLKDILSRIHEGFGDEGIAAYLHRKQLSEDVLSPKHVSVDPKRLEKDTGISQDNWKKILQELNEASPDPSPQDPVSQKTPAQGRRKDYRSNFERRFKDWAQENYPGKSIPNPNPKFRSNPDRKIEVTTLFDYAAEKDSDNPLRQQTALADKRRLWYEFQQSQREDHEKRRNSNSRSLASRELHGHSSGEDGDPFVGEVSETAVTAPGSVVKGDASVVENSYIGKDAVISGGEVQGNATVTGGEISGGYVTENAVVSGGEISGYAMVADNAQVSGGEISGDSEVRDNAVVSGGTISDGRFGGDCKIRGGNWNNQTLRVMRSMPEYEEHFENDGDLLSNEWILVSGEWDDVPEDVKKKLEPFGPTGQHPDAKVENPENIGPDALIGKDAVISGGRVQGNAQVSGGEIRGGKVSGNAEVTGGEISGGIVYGNATVSGGKISGGDVFTNAVVSGGEISGDAMVNAKAQVSGDAKISGRALVSGNAKVTGGEIGGKAEVRGEAQVSGGEISGGDVYGNAEMSGGTISGGKFRGDCKIRGGNWSQATLRVMRSMPEYKEHFDVSGFLFSGEWDDVPEDVKKKLEPFGPTGQHPDAKIENPENIGPDALIGKDAVISGRAKVRGNAMVSGDTISGGTFGGDCQIRGGNWNQGALLVMRRMPEYEEHFNQDGVLLSGEWDDVPEDVEKKLEPFGPTGQHPDAKIENPENIWPDVLVGKNAVISGGDVSGNAVVTGGKISGGYVTENAVVSGGEISGDAMVADNAVVSGGEISGDARVTDNAVVSGGTISSGQLGGDCKIRGGDWNRKTLYAMRSMPKYKEHFNWNGVLISGEWDDVPDDVKAKLGESGS